MVSEGRVSRLVKAVFARRGGILFVVVYSHEKFPQGLRRLHGQPLMQTQESHIVIVSHTQLFHPKLDNKTTLPPLYSSRFNRTRCFIWRYWALDHTYQHATLQTHWNGRRKHKLSISWQYSEPMTAVHSFTSLKVTSTTGRLA